MRNKRFTLTLIVISAVLLFSSFAFAAFSQNLSVSGSASAEMRFDVYFAEGIEDAYDGGEVLLTGSSSAPGVTVVSSGADGEGLNGGANDYLKLNVSLPNFSDRSFEFNVGIYNSGTMDASVSVNGAENTANIFSFAIKNGPVVIPAGQQAEVTVVVTVDGDNIKAKEYKGVILKILAEQATIADPNTPNPVHDHKVGQ